MMSRSAWMLVSGVLAQNWIDRSPWHSAASSASFGWRCIWAGAQAFSVREAEALVEQRGADRHRHRQPVGLHHRTEDAGARGRQLGVGVGLRAALREEGDALGERLEQPLQVGAVLGQHEERGDHAGRRARRDDARLVLAMELVVVLGLLAFRGFGHLRRGRGCQGVAGKACASDGSARGAQAHQDTAAFGGNRGVG
jgi:hypothetical protein